MKLDQLLENEIDAEAKNGRIVSKHKDIIIGNFDCQRKQLTTLEGCPSSVRDYFYCRDNQLTSLEGCPSFVGEYFICCGNKLTSLEGIHKHLKKMGSRGTRGTFSAYDNPITSHVLGLFFVQDCYCVELDNKEVEAIMNKHLPNGRDGLIPCQNELIEAGFEDFAQI